MCIKQKKYYLSFSTLVVFYSTKHFESYAQVGRRITHRSTSNCQTGTRDETFFIQLIQFQPF
jgi:hypothetical protein